MANMVRNASVMGVVICMVGIMFEVQLCMCMCEETSTSTSAPVAVPNVERQETVRFRTSTRVTAGSYSRFMLQLLNILTANADIHSTSIPILPQLPKNRTTSYVHVEISNDLSQTITFAVEIMNVYVVGYQNHANNVAYFFSDMFGDNNMQIAAFPDAVRRERLVFRGNYDTLGDRSTAPLGFSQLSSAISALYHNPPTGQDATPVRRAFLVVIQMISEAARLKNLRNLILDTIQWGGSFIPDGLVQAYENKWSAISCQVQKAIPDGDFQTPVVLAYDSQQLVLRKVSQVLPVVALLLRDCKRSETRASLLLSTTPFKFNRPSINSTTVA